MPRHRLRELFRRRARIKRYAAADLIIAVAPDVGEALRRALPSARVEVIANPVISPAFLGAAGNAIVAPWPNDPAIPLVIGIGRFAIAYNGEIYNFPDIRAELDANGANIAWRGESDTEVLLAAIDHWGVAATLARLNGMFAFALWDREARKLTLARDRMGEKPLYYGATGGAFLFGSELKALRAHPDFIGRLDRDALVAMLRYDYVPAPHSIWQGSPSSRPGIWSRSAMADPRSERRLLIGACAIASRGASPIRSPTARNWSTISKPC